MPEDNQSPTPEQELLKIIEAKKGTQDEPQIKAKATLHQTKTYLSGAGIRARSSYFKDILKGITFQKPTIDFRTVNTMLMLLASVAVIILLADFITSTAGMGSEVEAAFSTSEQAKGFKFSEIASIRNSSYYLEKARKRDIFDIVPERVVTVTTNADGEVIDEGPSEIILKSADLKLVGISWSQDPDVMVENTKSNKTFFLKRGDTVNGLTISDILRDKIILNYKGDEVELK
jgi:hypothetical protein